MSSGKSQDAHKGENLTPLATNALRWEKAGVTAAVRNAQGVSPIMREMS